jgi:hypothetical protein
MLARTIVTTAGVALLLLVPASTASAARVRYHYVTCAGSSTVQLRLPGERLTWLGAWEPYPCPPPRPTHTILFRHPCTGQHLNIPLSLPDDSPRLEYRPMRVIYNYGSYTVEVHFLPDGNVDVIYNSGLFRAL